MEKVDTKKKLLNQLKIRKISLGLLLGIKLTTFKGFV